MAAYSIMRSTLGRLPAYLKYLQGLDLAKNKYISATEIAKALGLGDVQVRKDLNAVSGAGRPKVGYATKDLIKILEEVLGINNTTKAVIVGAGKIGRALLGYANFEGFGVDIVAAFDISTMSPEKTSTGKFIYPSEMLEEFCQKENIQIGIITVPVCSAHSACERLVKSGIKAIWNFAPCSLNVPDDVIIQNENLALSLATLRLQAKS